MTEQEGGAVELADSESWELLERHALGRLAYHLGPEVHIVPVNYAVLGGQVLFRTAPGSKLLGVILSADVAFEVDEVDREASVARSVVLRGMASRLDDAQVHALGTRGPHPWVEWEADEVVAISPTSVSGRSFALHSLAGALQGAPWGSGLPDGEVDDGRDQAQ